MVTRPSSLCQRATDWDGRWRGERIVQVKHDGWHFMHIPGRGCFTLNGMPFRGTAHIERALDLLQAQFETPHFIDAEFVVGAGVNTLAQTKAHQDRGWRQGDAGVLYVFDAVPLDQWERDDCPLDLVARKDRLAYAFAAMMMHPLSWEYAWGDGVECPLKLVPDQWALGQADALYMAREIWAQGGEGVIIKDPETPYRRKRSNDWQKIKRTLKERLAA